LTDPIEIITASERKSSLPTKDFWRALARLSANDAILTTALKSGSYERPKSDPTKAEQPIATE